MAKLFLLLILLPINECFCLVGLIPRVLEDLSTHKDLKQFSQLLRDNENARRILRHRELTILAPTDEAFDEFRGRLDENLLLYHLLPIALAIEGLEGHAEQKQPMQSVQVQLPNLWLSMEDNLYINDAMLLKNDSNHQSRSREDDYGKLQIVHKINKVLSPMIVPMALSTSPTAYDFLAQTSTWPLVSYTLNNYYKRVIMTSSVPLYKEPVEGHTFLIPADEFRTSLEDTDITQEAIKCSIIPSVIFIHPTLRNTSFHTLSRDCEITFQDKQIESHDTLNHHLKTIKILQANIPLKNGVAHIVEHMPGVWQTRMAPIFPQRTLWDHINNDYFLQTQTMLLQNITNVEIQNLRNDNPKNYTIFVVNDQNWQKFMEQTGQSFKYLMGMKNFEKFIMRHVTEEIYDTQRLVDVTKTSLRGDTVTLGLGIEKIIAKFTNSDDGVRILWGTKIINILKRNIKCTNGIIHVIDAPFIFTNEIKDEGFNILHLWKTITKIMYRMHRSERAKSVTIASSAVLSEKSERKLPRAEKLKQFSYLFTPKISTAQPQTHVSFYNSSDVKIQDSSSSTNAFLDDSKSFSSTTTTSQDEMTENLTRFNVRPLLYEDIEEVKKLMDARVLEVFHIEDPFETIHNCFISYKLVNILKKIVAVICMDEYPNVPALPQVGWSHWADKLYNIKDLTSYNSLWVHLVAYDKKYEFGFLFPILNNLFHELMIKQFTLFVIPKGCHDKVTYLDGCSSVVLPKDFTDPMQVQTIRLCVRQDFITQYKIRRAVEEDNDDLVPLIHQFSPRFVELYGEYYVAEIISRHHEGQRSIIVAEHEGEAVSVLCLNSTVNYDQLNECFDLHVFTGLYKAETARQEARKPVPKPSPVQSIKEELPPPQSSIFPPGLSILERPIERYNSRKLDEVRLKSKSTFIDEELLFGWMKTSEAALPAKGLTFSILDNIEDLSPDSSTSSIHLTLNKSHASDFMVYEEASSEDTISIPSELPFMGTENAFAIEILAAHAKHQTSLPFLIISCFECFPTRDYCLLMMPHTSDYSAILNYFVRVQPKLSSQHPHELYICHRGQLTPIRIKHAEIQDAEKVANFINLIQPPNTPGEIITNFEKGCSGEEPIATFLALSGKHHRYPVGIAQVTKVTDLTSMKMKYAINQRSDIRRDSDFTFGYLLSFVISPLFKGHLKYFLREIHRKTEFKTLFYALNYHDSMNYRVRPLSFAMKDMWLVPPRKIKVSVKKQQYDYPEEPYALFISTPNLMSKQEVQINQRIVVVGASDTALSFLEKLLTNEVTQCLVTFTNVLLVSTDGLIRDEKRNKVRNMLNATHTLRDYVYMEKTGLRSKISVLKGSLTGIDRKVKNIRVGKSVIVPYDYLFLMTGLQYGPPKKAGAKEFEKTKLPTNCFTINNEADGDRALNTLRRLLDRHGNKPYQIVIYGHSIDCYCCIAALIEFGIPCSHITFIEPVSSVGEGAVNHEFVFQDGGIFETADNLVKKYGVETKLGFKLVDWYSKPLTLKFESFTRYLVLTPLCAFLYSDKAVNVEIFKAIHEAGLVFDGRLVIDPDCHTNDEFIFGAGPVTKYSRKLWADHLSHQHFNSQEIGARLGRAIRTLLLPFKERKKVKYEFGKSCWRQSKHMVPYYFKPLLTYCKLPGGLRYLNVVKPGPQTPLETAMSDSDYGFVYTTGNCKNLNSQGYFRIHLNNHRMVETITCLSAQKFDYRKLVLLWGKHEALLNNLVRRFESIYITDLFEYFQKAWCSAIFLDDFPLLESAIMKIMTSVTEVPGESPLEDLYRMYMENGFKPLPTHQRQMILEKFTDSGFEEQIQLLIMEFIRDHLSVLDMYAHPVIVNYILSGYEQSPMFKKI